MGAGMERVRMRVRVMVGQVWGMVMGMGKLGTKNGWAGTLWPSCG